MGFTENILVNIFGFWPLLFLTLLFGLVLGRSKVYKALKISVRIMIIIWAAFALLLAYAFAFHLPLKTWFIPDPLNIRLFLVSGFLLFGLQLQIIFLYKRYEKKDIYTFNTLEELLKLPAQDLLAEIGVYFRYLGHGTKMNALAESGKAGSLLVKTKLGQKWVIQLLHNGQTAGEKQFLNLLDCMDQNHADLGVLISTSGFEANLIDLTAFQPVKLLDGSHLLKMFDRLHNLKIHSAGKPFVSAAENRLSEDKKSSVSKQALQA